MPFVLIVLVLAMVVSFLRGGRLRRLADAPLRWSGLLLVGLALRVAAELAGGQEVFALGSTASALVVTGQLLVLAWAVGNRHLPGVALVVIGLGLNAVVTSANGAMPVDPAAIQALGVDGVVVVSGSHTLMNEGTRLPILADVWAVPVLRSVISIGDVVLAAGLIPLTHGLMAPRPEPEPA